MSKPKGVARAAKELRRQQAEARNAVTPEPRRRRFREGDAADRVAVARTLAAPAPRTPSVKAAPPARKQPTVPVAARVPGEPITRPGGRKPRPVRVVVPARRVHVAPRRIGDGIRANHAARAVAIGSLFAAAPAEAVVLR